MRYKKIIMLTIILAFLLAVSAVSASENITCDVVGLGETNENIGVLQDTPVTLNNSNDDIDVNVGNFAELDNLVQKTPENGTLYLNSDFKCVAGEQYTFGVSVDHSITIDGNGHTIDADTRALKVFGVSSNNVIIKNVVFKNIWWYADYRSTGAGAVCWSGSNGVLENCSFEDFTTLRGPSAISWSGSNGTINNCTFKNIGRDNIICRFYGSNITLNKCVFINNTGLITMICYVYAAPKPSYGDYVYFNDCSFINHKGNFECTGNSGVINCSFIDCSKNIKLEGFTMVDNSLFINNTYGVDISSKCINNSIFINNSNCNLRGNGLFVNNCTFEDCGATINITGNNVKIDNCYFNDDIVINLKGENQSFIKKDSNLHSVYSSFFYHNPIGFSAQAHDDNGRPFKNIPLVFQFVKNEQTIEFISKTDDTGYAYIFDELNMLNAGLWNLTVIFEGNNNFYSCNQTVEFEVLPLNVSLTIDEFESGVGYPSIIIVHINSTLGYVNDGWIYLYDDNKLIDSNMVYNGRSAVGFTPPASGKHLLRITFNESSNFADSIKNFEVNVKKADTQISIEHINNVYYNDESIAYIRVTSNQKTVSKGIIKLYVNGTEITTTNASDMIKFSYVAPCSGTFELNAKYLENDDFFSSVNSTIFTVDKMPTTLSADTVIFDEQQLNMFTVILKDKYGQGIYNQSVILEVIKYSGEFKSFTNATDNNGLVVYDVSGLSGGMWYVTGTFSENNNYIFSKFSNIFIIIKMDTTTKINEIKNPYKGANIQLSASILDDSGQLVTEGRVHYYVDDNYLGYIDLSMGIVVPLKDAQLLAKSNNEIFKVNSNLYFNYVPNKLGSHNLTVIYEGTDLYKSSNQTTTFFVNEGSIPTTLNALPVSTVYNGGNYLVATLIDSSKNPLIGVNLNIILSNGKTVSRTTDVNGQVKVSTDGLAPKTYTVTVTFEGNKKYGKAIKSVKVSVKKATPKLTAKAKTFKKSDKTKKYTVTLKTNQNKVMKNTKVTLKVNGKTYTAKTNTKGVATFKLTKLTKKGKFTATVKYAGNKYYNAKTVKPKITVK